MNRHFVLITVETDERNLTGKLRKALDRAIDWIELTPQSWLLWSSSSCNGWLKRVHASGLIFENVFIVEINPAERAGVMPDQVWQFIRKRQED